MCCPPITLKEYDVPCHPPAQCPCCLQADGSAVHIKTRTDQRMYRGIMVFSVFGLAITFASIYAMATNKMPKKER